jgi:hypothetical protein
MPHHDKVGTHRRNVLRSNLSCVGTSLVRGTALDPYAQPRALRCRDGLTDKRHRDDEGSLGTIAQARNMLHQSKGLLTTKGHLQVGPDPR